MPNGQVENDYIRSWISTMASTAGIMLTISLGVLTILFASNVTLTLQQVTIIGLPIASSSVLLIASLILLVLAHGTLILVAGVPDEPTPEKQCRLKRLREKLLSRSRQAEYTFVAGAVSILIAIFITIIVAQFQ